MPPRAGPTPRRAGPATGFRAPTSDRPPQGARAPSCELWCPRPPLLSRFPLCASGIIDDGTGPHPRPCEPLRRRPGSGTRVGAEVFHGCLAGHLRVAPDVDPAGDLQPCPIGHPDDAVVHDELKGLGDLVVAKVVAGRELEDLLSGAQVGNQVLHLLLGGDVEVEVVLPSLPVAYDRPVLAELGHDAAVALEVVRDRR